MRKLLIGIAILFISFSCVKENNVKHIITEFYNSSSTNVLVVAHRGDWRHAPENSIKGIENSIEMGVDIVEIDVRKTKDNQLVLMHDGTIDRTTNGKGKVSDFTLDELHQFYLKNNQGGKDAELTDQKIPTLEEVMMAFDGQGSELLSSQFLEIDGKTPADLYHPFILAGVKFQVEDYSGAIRAILDAIELEGRTSVLMAAIYVAALENNGNHKAAEQFARNLMNTWQPVQFRRTIASLFSNEPEVLAIVVPLEGVMVRMNGE